MTIFDPFVRATALRTRSPMGLRAPAISFANERLTTISLRAPEPASNVCPAMSGIRIIPKYSGGTT
jgi:hypothetical protein